MTFLWRSVAAAEYSYDDCDRRTISAVIVTHQYERVARVPFVPLDLAATEVDFVAVRRTLWTHSSFNQTLFGSASLRLL